MGLLLLFVLTLQAQIPTAWQTKYATCNGLRGAALKTKLYKIIASHTQKSYDALWTCYETTDVHPNGTIWDMYSTTTDGNLHPSDHSGNYAAEGDLLNREHSVPSSWFGKAAPMYTDLFHVIPTDGYINGMRSNYPYGETNSPTKTSDGGFSKLGPCDASIGYSGTVFEPNDEYKGDLARNYFYMATCYEDNVATWDSPMFGNTTYPAFTAWAKTMLVRWATTDVVSTKETARNNAVYAIQGNRNPFIDYPGLEDYVFGSKTDRYVVLNADGTISETDTPAPDDSGEGDWYEEVTSTSQLEAGKQYIVVYPTGKAGMKYNGSNFVPVDYTANLNTTTGKIDITGLDVAVLTLGGAAGAWTFSFTYNNTSYYLQCAAKNTLTPSNTASTDAQKWTIDPTASDPVCCKGQIESESYYLQYNTSGYFRCYKKTQQSIKLYVQSAESGSQGQITPAAPTFSVEDESEVEQGSSVTISTATSGATVKYSTDGGTTWSGSSASETLTLNTLGTTTIQAKSVLGTEESNIVEVSYSVVAPVLHEYVRITSTEDLEAGKKYLIVNETNNKTLGSQTNNNISATGITITNHATSVSATSCMVLTLGGASGSWTLQTDAGLYLYCPSDNNYLRSKSDGSGNDAKWTIAFTSESNVTIVNKSVTSREIKYNSSGTLFSCYSSGQLKCQLYKEVESTIPADPTFNPDGGTITVGKDVKVECATSGAKVWYKVDSDTEWSGGNSALETVTLSAGVHTITAKSTNSVGSSSEISKTFTVKPNRPAISPDAGNYTAAQTVTLTSSESGAIYYTLNGLMPNTSATLYSAPFTVTESTRIRAIAVVNGVESSELDATINIVAPSAEVDVFERITSTAQLVAGEDYLIVYQTGATAYALGSQNGNFRNNVSVTLSDQLIDLTNATTMPTILTLGGASAGYTFDTGDGNYLQSPSANNYLKTTTTVDSYAQWTITWVNDAAFSIQNVGRSSYYMQYNTSSPRFSCYTNTQKNVQIYRRCQTGTFNVSRFGYGTYFDGQAFYIPEGVTGYTFTDGSVGSEGLTVGQTYTAGDLVPANTALLTSHDLSTAQDYTFCYSYQTPAAVTLNLLHGSLTGVAAEDMASVSGVSASDNYFYKLTTYQGANMGFYWGADDGGPFQMKSGNKCWLTLPKTMGTRGFALNLDMLTGIACATTTDGSEPAAIYDLQGRRVKQAVRGGIYIVGGKKVLIR